VIDLLSRLVGVVGEFGAALMAFLWARDRARGEALARKMEVQNAILEAGRDSPRDQSDATRRLREGNF
jgi:hypothetical protein